MKLPECEDKSLLVAFLYDDCDPGERERMEAHLARCAECAGELEGLRATRGTLGAWAPPEPALGFRVVREEVKRSRWAWPVVPVWAQAAAAVLVLAAGVGIANLDVTVGQQGVTIHTGWSRPAAQAAAVPAAPAGVTRAELVALQREVDRKLAGLQAPATVQQASVAAPAAATLDLAPVKTLIAQSLAQQKTDFDRQLAARFVDFQADVSSRQRADFVRLQQGFTRLQQGTAADLASLRQAQNNVQSLLVRVANVQEIR